MLEETYKQKERGYYGYARPEMRPFIPAQTRRMLDVGCGNGSFSNHFKTALGVETWGIELLADAATEARKTLDRVFQGDFDSTLPLLPLYSFDTIVFNDVLEHLLDPEKALKDSLPLLAPCGAVVASIPNFIFWPNLRKLIASRDWEYTDAGILDKTHLRFFTRKSILRLFASAGYTVEKCQGINPYQWTWRSRWLHTLFKARIDDFCPAQYAVVAHAKPH